MESRTLDASEIRVVTQMLHDTRLCGPRLGVPNIVTVKELPLSGAQSWLASMPGLLTIVHLSTAGAPGPFSPQVKPHHCWVG